MFGNMFNFNGLFGHIGSGLCRLAMNGRIAVKTSQGYKTYDPKNETLVNCSNFCFDAGDELFFSIPTNKVTPGNIIIANKLPRHVIDVSKGDKRIEVLTYETDTIETIIPQRHIFMGKTYFYGRIFSPFCGMFGNKKGGMAKMMQMAMMGRMLGQSGATGANNEMMSSMMMLSMMGGGNVFEHMFDGMFDEDADDGLDFDFDAEEAAEKETPKKDKEA